MWTWCHESHLLTKWIISSGPIFFLASLIHLRQISKTKSTKNSQKFFNNSRPFKTKWKLLKAKNNNTTKKSSLYSIRSINKIISRILNSIGSKRSWKTLWTTPPESVKIFLIRWANKAKTINSLFQSTLISKSTLLFWKVNFSSILDKGVWL